MPYMNTRHVPGCDFYGMDGEHGVPGVFDGYCTCNKIFIGLEDDVTITMPNGVMLHANSERGHLEWNGHTYKIDGSAEHGLSITKVE